MKIEFLGYVVEIKKARKSSLLEDRVKSLLDQDRYSDAIRYYRGQTGENLREAIIFVNQHR